MITVGFSKMSGIRFIICTAILLRLSTGDTNQMSPVQTICVVYNISTDASDRVSTQISVGNSVKRFSLEVANANHSVAFYMTVGLNRTEIEIYRNSGAFRIRVIIPYIWFRPTRAFKVDITRKKARNFLVKIQDVPLNNYMLETMLGNSEIEFDNFHFSGSLISGSVCYVEEVDTDQAGIVQTLPTKPLAQVTQESPDPLITASTPTETSTSGPIQILQQNSELPTTFTIGPLHHAKKEHNGNMITNISLNECLDYSEDKENNNTHIRIRLLNGFKENLTLSYEAIREEAFVISHVEILKQDNSTLFKFGIGLYENKIKFLNTSNMGKNEVDCDDASIEATQSSVLEFPINPVLAYNITLANFGNNITIIVNDKHLAAFKALPTTDLENNLVIFIHGTKVSKMCYTECKKIPLVVAVTTGEIIPSSTQHPLHSWMFN